MVLGGKSSQEFPSNAGVPQGYILSPTFFLLHINDLPDDVICNIAIYADDTTLLPYRIKRIALSLSVIKHLIYGNS